MCTSIIIKMIGEKKIPNRTVKTNKENKLKRLKIETTIKRQREAFTRTARRKFSRKILETDGLNLATVKMTANDFLMWTIGTGNKSTVPKFSQLQKLNPSKLDTEISQRSWFFAGRKLCSESWALIRATQLTKPAMWWLQTSDCKILKI